MERGPGRDPGRTVERGHSCHDEGEDPGQALGARQDEERRAREQSRLEQHGEAPRRRRLDSGAGIESGRQQGVEHDLERSGPGPHQRADEQRRQANRDQQRGAKHEAGQEHDRDDRLLEARRTWIGRAGRRAPRGGHGGDSTVGTVARPRHRTGPLAGRVVVVSADALDAAHALAREGAAVVILGGDGPAAGAAAAAIEQSGGRAAVFAGDLRRNADRAALAEMVDELFASRTEPGTLEAD